MSLVSRYFKLLKDTTNAFMADNGVKLGASLAYYTVFSIGPFLLVLISVAGLIYKPEAISNEVYLRVSNFIGPDAAAGIQGIMNSLKHQEGAFIYRVVGLVTLVIGATSVFAEIQDSINYIWSVKAKPKRGWVKYLRNRLLSFSLIVTIGFLLIVTLVINTLADALTAQLLKLFTDGVVVAFKLINITVLYLVTSLLFAIIYKVLPDARIAWKDAFAGAGFTALLFLGGKSLIGLYLGSSDVVGVYGTAASVIVLLLWVYYSSIILYFGAEFTRQYAIQMGRGIRPSDTSVLIIKQELKELPKT